MYIAKQSRKNCSHLFDVAKETQKKNQHEEIENIHAGIKNDPFVIHYQPKINISTNKVVGLQALICWQYPHEGQLPLLHFYV